MKVFQILLVVAVLFVQHHNAQSKSRLLDELFRGYNRNAPPAGTVNVNIQQSFQRVELDVENQELESVSLENKRWKDNRLAWDPTAYNVKQLIVNAGLVWQPDITAYNNARPAQYVYKGKLLISSDGTVLSSVSRRRWTFCITKLNETIQTCKIKLGSWTGSSTDINITHGSVDDTVDSYFIPSHKWDLVAANRTRNELYYACCVEAYIDITYTFVLKRKDFSSETLPVYKTDMDLVETTTGKTKGHSTSGNPGGYQGVLVLFLIVSSVVTIQML